MSGEERTKGAIIAEARPSAAARLQVPATLLQAGQNTHGRAGTLSARQDAMQAPSQRRSKLSPLKRLERYILAIFKLGRIEGLAKEARRRLDHVEHRLDEAEKRLSSLAQLPQDVDRVWEAVSQFERAHEDHGQRFDIEAEKAKANYAALARTMSDLTRRLDDLLLNRDRLPTPSRSEAEPATLPNSDGFDVFKDSFYHNLENRYRGSVEEISNRLRIYLPDVEAAILRSGGKPVMDIGCGRGEWLGLMSEMGATAFGVDTNPVQIAAAQERGLDVRLGDAVSALAEAETGSLSVITAHHVVEHVPFEIVAWIAREAMRVLAPGGLLLFETPHTRNVLVGATTFHTDPTHIKPMPEQVLGVLFETAGFHPVEIRALHPHERFDEFISKPDFNDELAFLMFGPQDLAVLGIKPTGE